ncbi:MAG: TetR/AcrR family transcriptional regulator [Oliverpabstia sp.]
MSMYTGTNPTALQSQRWIAGSLTGLMLEIPYTQITIQKICRRADLSRQTFYNFFDSKEEALRFCLREKYEQQLHRLDNKTTISLHETVEAFATVLEENRTLLSAMIQNNLDGIITDEIVKCVSLFTDRFVSKKDRFLPYSEALLSGALAHMLLCWFRQENPVSIQELTSLLTAFLSGNLYVFE